MYISIVIPFCKVMHFKGFRKIAESKFGVCKSLAHYRRGKKYFAKTQRNPFGEPNHYNTSGAPIGYSRKYNKFTYVHFDSTGKAKGYSKCILGILWFHFSWSKKKNKKYSDNAVGK